LCDARRRTPPGVFWDTAELKSTSSNMLVLQCVWGHPVFCTGGIPAASTLQDIGQIQDHPHLSSRYHPVRD
jgi:hypothetical protein